MLIETVGNYLPAAVAIALSPIPIIGVVLILGTPRAKVNGPGFALGWAAGLIILSSSILLIAGEASDPESAYYEGINWVQVVFGALFLFMAWKQWSKRPAHGAEPEMPAWMEAVDRFTPMRSIGLGVLLSSVNPKNLMLTVAAAATIAKAGLPTTDRVAAVGIFVLIASSTVAGLVAFRILAPRRAERSLASIKDFMGAHSAVIMMVILLVLGAKLIGDGLGGLG